jgi:transcriptional regulator with XRE-family HTH domain
MAHERKPAYVQAIQAARERRGWSQIQLSKEMGMATSWASMVEAGTRGIDINRLPVLAEKLELDKRSFVKAYLQHCHPAVFQSLYPEENFQAHVHEAAPGDAIHDMAFRLESLPRDLRRAIEGTILTAYDLAQQVKSRGPKHDWD